MATVDEPLGGRPASACAGTEIGEARLARGALSLAQARRGQPV
jgi:hypothetical protein